MISRLTTKDILGKHNKDSLLIALWIGLPLGWILVAISVAVYLIYGIHDANGGGLQNGVIDKYPLGAEFMDWNGNTCGYEGHLVYSFSFLQAALLRDPAMRKLVLSPLS
ncbi:MAG: hypothetical protein HYV26_23420 [Candidatus Hydrogenedentes bacterium]|nr:hypothetical protein [Candidatus Hydrogenedentota bacterium]